jgi:flavin-dependent dehydrogenase
MNSPREPLLIGFAGRPGFLRRSVGPGWALVGDAGYFRDPITAHGITDALRDAEALARAVGNGDGAMARYQTARDDLVTGLLDLTDRISTFEWSMEEVKGVHLGLRRETKIEVEWMKGWDP